MTEAQRKIIERLAALPERDRDAVEREFLEYLDWLEDTNEKIAEGEADIAAGRVVDATTVFDRLTAKFDI